MPIPDGGAGFARAALARLPAMDDAPQLYDAPALPDDPAMLAEARDDADFATRAAGEAAALVGRLSADDGGAAEGLAARRLARFDEESAALLEAAPSPMARDLAEAAFGRARGRLIDGALPAEAAARAVARRKTLDEALERLRAAAFGEPNDADDLFAEGAHAIRAAEGWLGDGVAQDLLDRWQDGVYGAAAKGEIERDPQAFVQTLPYRPHLSPPVQLQLLNEARGRAEAMTVDAETGRMRALNDSIRHPSLKSYASLEGMARSLVAAQRMVGKRIADATPEELGRFYDRHGRPETPEGYDFGGAAEASALSDSARRWFHAAGLSRGQAEALHRDWSAYVAEHRAGAEAQAAANRDAAERELRGEWGPAYDRRLRHAARAARTFGGEGLAALLEETRLGDDPRVIRAFARIAERLGEDGLGMGGLAGGESGEGRSDFGLSADGARTEIARLMTQPAYFDADHPEHDRSVARMRDLFAAAYPERHPTDAQDEA